MIRHIIKTQVDIDELLHQLDMSPTTTIPKLCLKLCENADTEGEKGITICINAGLLPSSYIQVPALFGRSLQFRCKFNVVQSYLEDDMIVMRASDTKVPLTFRARARQAIERKESFSCFRRKIPLSYRRRPGLFATILTQELDQPIRYISTQKKITWKLRPALED